MKVTITAVSVKDTKKDGSPLVTKKGDAFHNVGIQTEEHGEQWFSCLSFRADDKVQQLENGQQVEIEVETNGDFKNFRLLGKIVNGSDFGSLEEVVIKRGTGTETLYRPHGEAKVEEVATPAVEATDPSEGVPGF